VVTDDLAHVARRAGRYVIHPGPARLKLFPAAARATIGPRSAGRMNPGTPKLVVPLAATESVDWPVPVGALYLLEPTPTSGRITIDQLEPAAAMLAIVGAAFNVSVTDRVRLAAQFAAAGRLAASVPVKRLRYPRSLASLPSVCDSVLADLRP